MDIEFGDEADTSWGYDSFVFETYVCENYDVGYSCTDKFTLNNEILAQKELVLPLTYYSIGPKAHISFQSDMAFAGRGFRVVYKSIPNTKLRQTKNGTIISLNQIVSDKERKNETATQRNIDQRTTDLKHSKRAIDYDYDNKPALFLNFRSNIYAMYEQSKLSDYTDFRRAAFFPKTMVEHIGHWESDFIVQCTYDGMTCNRRGKDFIGYQDPIYGNCFSFNSVR